MVATDVLGTGEIAAAVLEEAIDEVTGRSKKKWAVMLLAFVAGAVVASFVIRRLREQSVSENEQI